MKRTLIIIAAIGLTALLSYLGVTRHMAELRAGRLDRALMDAETRVVQLEADLQAARQKLASVPAASVPASPPAAKGQSIGSSQGSAEAPGGPGPRVLYAATAGRGTTNLVRIEGTSTVHDWQVEGHLIGGTVEFGRVPFGQVLPASPASLDASVSVFIPVRSLKSVEKSGRPYSDAMDEIMYGKLKADEHKRITFTLTSLALKEPPSVPTAPLLCEATGQLTVAGVTNTITMPVKIAAGTEERLQFTGACRVKMTDFNITPPAPSVGGLSIKTGDEVTLRFEWWAKPVQPQTAAK